MDEQQPESLAAEILDYDERMQGASLETLTCELPGSFLERLREYIRVIRLGSGRKVSPDAVIAFALERVLDSADIEAQMLIEEEIRTMG